MALLAASCVLDAAAPLFGSLPGLSRVPCRPAHGLHPRAAQRLPGVRHSEGNLPFHCTPGASDLLSSSKSLSCCSSGSARSVVCEAESRPTDYGTDGTSSEAVNDWLDRKITSNLRRLGLLTAIAGLKLVRVVIQLINKIRLAWVRDVQKVWRLHEQQQRKLCVSLDQSETQFQQSSVAAVAKASGAAASQALVKMLHSLDNPAATLEAKWSSIQSHVAGTDEFSQRVAKLFSAAGESQRAAQAAAESSSKFWQLDSTVKVIAEEQAFRDMVFSQMLQASQGSA